MAKKRAESCAQNDRNVAEEQIRVLTRTLKRKDKKIAKLKEIDNQKEVQLGYLQEKIKIKNQKVVELKKKNKSNRQLMADNEKMKIEIVDQEIKMKKMSDTLKQTPCSSVLSQRIARVIQQTEERHAIVSPTVRTSYMSLHFCSRFVNLYFLRLQDDEIKKTVLDIFRSANLDETTMKHIYEITFAKYSHSDLKNKQKFMKSIIKAEVRNRFPNFVLSISIPCAFAALQDEQEVLIGTLWQLWSSAIFNGCAGIFNTLQHFIFCIFNIVRPVKCVIENVIFKNVSEKTQ